MSHNNFFNRSEELSYLQERYRSPHPELLILYGRRRIGKTELLNQFIKDKPAIYILCTTEQENQNIRLFTHECSLFLQDPTFDSITYPSFETLFTSLSSHQAFRKKTEYTKMVFVIDEFPYLIERNRAILSIFQRIWDLCLSKQPVILILSGSSISSMEHDVLGYTSPLFGRRTGQWQVEPLSFIHTQLFLPWDIRECAMVWFTTGGVPAYLELFDPATDFWSNISRLFLTKGAYLYSEAFILLQYEFREPANYLTILKAVAQGLTTMGEIINDTGLDRSMVSKYLSVLVRLHLVCDDIPVVAPLKTRKRNYRLIDPYLSFWFRFVYPEQTAIESRQTSTVLSRIQDSFSRYAGSMFELLVEHLIREQILLRHLPITSLGRWWYKETEIDLVGINEKTSTLLCIECKWSDVSAQDCRRILQELKEKSSLIDWRKNERTTLCILVGRKILEKATVREQGYEVYDLDDLAPPH